MPAYTVTWTQRAIATATVEIELRDLARWAIQSGSIRAGGSGAADAELEALTRSLERNPHLRDALLRLYSTATH